MTEKMYIFAERQRGRNREGVGEEKGKEQGRERGEREKRGEKKEHGEIGKQYQERDKIISSRV